MISLKCEDCIGCEICMDVCPHEAISMQDGQPQFDESKCVECDVCADECPTHAITHE